MTTRSSVLTIALMAATAACGGSSGGAIDQPPTSVPLTATPTTAGPTSPSATAGQPTVSSAASPTKPAAAATPTATPSPARTSAQPQPTKTANAACPANGKTATLSMQDSPTTPTTPYKFSSSSVSIGCGGKLTINNSSSAAHTFSPSHGGFKDSGNMDAGTSMSVSFFFKGSYGFFCTYHTYMTGTVHVT